ncbi:MAG: hypothetical protein AAF212_10035 [Verrucomicrobiota bacterium]
MANYESENFFDGDWDDKGDIAWNEYDWARYLKRCDAETVKFRDTYKRLITQPDRLDEAARKMGWDREDWSATIEDEGEESSDSDNYLLPDFTEMSQEPQRPEPSGSEEGDPYSAQRHPVFVVTRSLALDVEMFFMRLISRPELRIPAGLAWESASALKSLEMHVGMAVNSLDLGDFALAICYFKRCFSNLNALLSATSRLSEFLPPRLCEPFLEHVNIRLFDLREVWLRVITECREESNHNFGDESPDEGV